MPRSIDDGFRDFLTQLTPSAAESAAAKGHRASIESCLKSNFGVSRFFRSGSFGNATSISGYSDVDYFAVVPTSNLKSNSTTSLTAVREALDARFPRTGVRTNCPAIAVPFGSSAADSTEVVVADDVGKNAAGFQLYDIADCRGGWKKTSPDAHDAYVRGMDTKLSNKVKPLIRFVKAWRFFNQVPLASFYLELRAAQYCSGESSIVYYVDLARFFGHLQNVALVGLQDPMGVSGIIYGCQTTAQLVEAKSKLATAVTRTQKIYEAQQSGDTKTAFDYLGYLFSGKFPSYYL